MRTGEPVFFYLGLPVRLAGRRPNGLLLVESLLRDTSAPMGSWREVDPGKLQHARPGQIDLRQVAERLPMVVLSTDQRADTTHYWWNDL